MGLFTKIRNHSLGPVALAILGGTLVGVGAENIGLSATPSTNLQVSSFGNTSFELETPTEDLVYSLDAPSEMPVDAAPILPIKEKTQSNRNITVISEVQEPVAISNYPEVAQKLAQMQEEYEEAYHEILKQGQKIEAMQAKSALLAANGASEIEWIYLLEELNTGKVPEIAVTQEPVPVPAFQPVDGQRG